MERGRRIYSIVASGRENTQHLLARGVHFDGLDGVHGRGLVPVGWVDCAWDYEQSKGYQPMSVGEVQEKPWDSDVEDSTLWAPMDYTFSYDEVGVYPHDFSDECEDELSGTAPPRRIDHRGAYDFEPEWLKPILDYDEIEKQENLAARGNFKDDDEYAEEWMEELAQAEAAARRQAEEEATLRRYAQLRADARKRARELAEQEREEIEKKPIVTDPYKRRPVMEKKARELVIEHLRAGQDGEFSLEIVEGDQRLRWEYRIEGRKAYITYRKIGWIPIDERA